MSDGKKNPVKIQPRFQRAAQFAIKLAFGKKEEAPNQGNFASINLGHKIGSIESHASQRRAAKRRKRISAKLPMRWKI